MHPNAWRRTCDTWPKPASKHAPPFLCIDEHGREMLGFVDGEVTADGQPHGVYTDAGLTAAARLLRRSHDTTIEFAPAHPTGWRRPVQHRAGRPVAFIDWYFDAPRRGKRLLESTATSPTPEAMRRELAPFPT